MLNTLKLVPLLLILCAGFSHAQPPEKHPCPCLVTTPASKQMLAPVWALTNSRETNDKQAAATRGRLKMFLSEYDLVARVLIFLQEFDRIGAFTGGAFLANSGEKGLRAFLERQLPEVTTLIHSSFVDDSSRQAAIDSLQNLEPSLRDNLACLQCMDRGMPWPEDKSLASEYDLLTKWSYAYAVLDYTVAHETETQAKSAALRLRESMFDLFPDLHLLLAIQAELAVAGSKRADVKPLGDLKDKATSRLQEFILRSDQFNSPDMPKIVRHTASFLRHAINVYVDDKHCRLGGAF